MTFRTRDDVSLLCWPPLGTWGNSCCSWQAGGFRPTALWKEEKVEAAARTKSGHSRHYLTRHSLSALRSTADSFLFPSCPTNLGQNTSGVALRQRKPKAKPWSLAACSASDRSPHLPLPLTCFNHQLRRKVTHSRCFFAVLSFSSLSPCSSLLCAQKLPSAFINARCTTKTIPPPQIPSQVSATPSHPDMQAQIILPEVKAVYMQ